MYQFEILKSSSVKAVRSLGTKIIGTKERFTRGQAVFARLVTQTDKAEQTQKAQMVSILRPYIRKFASDKKAMHAFQREIKVAGLGAVALKPIKKLTVTEKRAYNAFAKVQSDATRELGINAHSKSRGFTMPRGVAGKIDRAVRRELNTVKGADFEYSVRVTRGHLTVSVSRVA